MCIREAGKIEWVTGLFFLLLLAVLLCTQLEISMYQTAGGYLEDALAASNLASAVIDVEEYGISHTVRIADGWQAYGRYRNAVQGNLRLNDDWENPESAVMAGKITVENYTIYNVRGDQVNVWSIREDGGVSTMQGNLGSIFAPNGKKIEHTSVYSEISFPVKGLFGVRVQAHKGKLVDIVSVGDGDME